MAEKSWPFVSVEGDRKVPASDEAQGYDLFVASGVVPGIEDELAPEKVADTMNVQVNPGAGIVTGHRYILDAADTVTLANGEANARIDLVVLESNANTPVRAVRLAVVKGTAATSPVAPALTWDSAVQQIELARVHVPAGATTLNAATLTDMRRYATGRHTHDLVDTTTGTLPITRGGTGATSASGALSVLGAAPASHNHAASNITSGAIPITRGGTGKTTASDARSALDAAASSHNHSASHITSGTLPITRGGTGATSASGARSALAAAAASHTHSASHIVSSTLPIVRGGTGATSASAARSALGAEAVLDSTRKRKITYGTANPSGGKNGDIYIKY
jgi:hypothetical protein